MICHTPDLTIARYQFFHLETFADKPRKGTDRPSAEAVARECQRVEKSFPHIPNMKPADLLYGIEPLEALNKVRELLKQSKDPLGRKIRSDAQNNHFWRCFNQN